MIGQTRPDVSVVKAHPDRVACADVRVLPGGQFEAGCFTLELMIREGLNILPNQLSGGPDWVRHDRWDISAKAASLAGKPDEDIYRQLLMGVVVERFSLKLHSEKRSAKGFVLVVAEKEKPGPGLRLNSGEPHSFSVKAGPSLSVAGTYDVDLRWAPLQSSRTSDPGAEPVIFSALRQQLGLKLVSAQVDEEMYEIQGAERPAPN
jgi:hypothetical protein